MKKIISIFLMAMFLMTTVSFTAFADDESTNTYTIYNAANGVTTSEGHTIAEVQQKYTGSQYYSEVTSTGTISTTFDGKSKYPAIGWSATVGRWVNFMRFPLSAVTVSEGKEIDSVTLTVAFREAHDFTDTNMVLGAYKDFTQTSFGDTITYLEKTYSELIADTNLVGSVALNQSYAAGDTVSIDVTDYVKGLMNAEAASADFALNIPGATELYNIYQVQNACELGLKPHLTVKTKVADASYPTIDTVAREGKTKIQMQTTTTGTLTNESATVFSTSTKEPLTYNLNCITAGKYYVTVYVVGKNTNATSGTLKVNSTEVSTKVTLSNAGTTAFDSGEARLRMKANTFEVTLKAGLNVLEFIPGGSSLGVCLVELTNYPRAEIGTGYSITEKGVEVRAENQPTAFVYPTVVYKVYDTIAAAKATGVTGAGLTAQISNANTSALGKGVSFVAAKFEGGLLKDVEIVTNTDMKKLTQNTIDFGEFSLSGDEVEFSFFVWKTGILEPLTEAASIK